MLFRSWWYGKSVLARSFSFQRLPAEKIRNEERLIREAKVRLVREINRLGVVRGRGGAGRLIGTYPHGPGRWEGQHRQLIRELNLRSVEVFLRLSNVI